MDAKHLAVGQIVRVALAEEAMFLPLGHYKGTAINQETGRHHAGQKKHTVIEAWPPPRREFTPLEWIDDCARPWYPHGQVVRVRAIVGQFFALVDGESRSWPWPIGCWALDAVEEPFAARAP